MILLGIGLYSILPAPWDSHKETFTCEWVSSGVVSWWLTILCLADTTHTHDAFTWRMRSWIVEPCLYQPTPKEMYGWHCTLVALRPFKTTGNMIRFWSWLLPAAVPPVVGWCCWGAVNFMMFLVMSESFHQCIIVCWSLISQPFPYRYLTWQSDEHLNI